MREQEILAVGRAIFAERGYAEVSMDEVARRAGVSKPMVYAYFGSKPELFGACAQQAGAELREAVRRVTSAELAPDQRLWAGLRQVFRFVDENREAWRLLYPGGTAARGVVPGAAHAALDAMAQLITELFTDAGRRQGFDEQALEHAPAFADIFTAATVAAASRWAERRDEPAELAALRLMNFCWNGLGNLAEGEMWLPTT